MINLLARNATRTSHLEKSFIAQRRGMAILAAAFPAVFLASSWLLGRTEFQTSISAYYWTLDLERNVFVGILCAVGVFLLLYKGYTLLEDRVLDVAGICAVGVAFFPMDKAGDCASAGFSLHGVFGVMFFACIFFICIFMSKHSLEDIPDQRRREKFALAYKICSTVMIGSIVLAVLSRFLPKEYIQALCENSAIFWFEAVGVWAFSAFWYIKTRELDPSLSWIPFRKVRGAHASAE
jgi:hypothetical protein